MKLILFISFLLCAWDSEACAVQKLSRSQTMAKSDLILTGQVLERTQLNSSQKPTYSYQIKIDHIKKGHWEDEIITVTFFEPSVQPYQLKSGKTYCPRVYHTGIESNLKLKQSYEFLLEAELEDSYSLLRASKQ